MTVWHYPRCTVVNVVDADTVHVDMDLGQDIWIRRRSVRLVGIAARELSEPGGKEARDYLRQLLPVGTQVEVMSTGWDKFAGRVDGVVYLDNCNINDRLVEEGWAARWDGRGPQPEPAWPREAA